jgi:hypothetical protein
MPYMKKAGIGLIAILMLGATGLIGVASAQNGTSQRQLDIAAAKAERKAVVGQNMQLTPDQAKVFWPLYDKYEAAMDKIDARHAQEIRNYAKNFRNMSDDAAKAKLDEVIEVAQGRVDVQKEFIPQFRAVLPQMKVTRFFQIDNKLHAMVQCQIAQLIPLVGTPPPSATGANN